IATPWDASYHAVVKIGRRTFHIVRNTNNGDGPGQRAAPCPDGRSASIVPLGDPACPPCGCGQTEEEHAVATLQVNGQERAFDGDPSMPLLWFLRDELGLIGTKFGCGAALCGNCTVHVDG